MNMVSGLFKGHHINQPSQRALSDMLAAFAEELAGDEAGALSFNQIADRLHVTRGTACVLWRLLCQQMGETMQ